MRQGEQNQWKASTQARKYEERMQVGKRKREKESYRLLSFARLLACFILCKHLPIYLALAWVIACILSSLCLSFVSLPGSLTCLLKLFLFSDRLLALLPSCSRACLRACRLVVVFVISSLFLHLFGTPSAFAFAREETGWRDRMQADTNASAMQKASKPANERKKSRTI